MSENWISSWTVIEDTPAVLSLGKLFEDHGYNYPWTSGQKPHLIKKWQEDRLQHSEWSIDKLFNLIFTNFSHIFIAGNRGFHGASSINKKSESMSGEVQGNLSHEPAEIENPNKNDDEGVRGNPLRDLPEWLEEFTENLVDDSVPVHRDASSSSRESSSEQRAKVVCTQFPKDRNCDICLGTKITRASCRKCTGTVVPGAENFGDLITVDQKVLTWGCESRNNHRYAVVVQDLATQWIQSYPCKTKTSQETQKGLQKFLEPTDEETKSHSHWQFFGIWESLWRSVLESFNVNTAQIGNKWDCWESSAQKQGRNICGTVAIRPERKMVGGFHAMLRVSRSLVWWVDTLWKAVRSSIWWPSFFVWSDGRISPCFC